MAVALFDLDGTLTDPKEGITKSVQYGFARIGITVDDLDALVAYIGPPLQDSFVTLAGLSAADAAEALIGYREYFADRGMFENVPYDGIAELLDGLRADGWRLAVVTSKPTVFAEAILVHFGLRDAFEVVAGAELDGSRRHKHDVIAHALAGLGCRPDECVMIGDREHDVLGARRAGVPSSIGVLWGYGSRDELEAAGAGEIVENIDELALSLRRSRSV
ncbi:MAG: HAD family hydrolase [Ilumatobacteraceae bacterium]